MMLRAALFLPLLLSACQSVGVPMVDRGPVDQSIVFLIHGDADYLFHDSDGVAHLADVEALEKAKRVGMRNPNAEVFIFHQRPRKRLLFLFPRDDGTFYHFRGGVLLAEETYKRGMGPAWLEAELDYYRRLRSASAVNMLVYMGHEIPEMNGVQYHASRRNGAFSMGDFSRGMAGLTAQSGPFDLMVLSTCYNGTPYSVRAMAPFTEHLVASPDNLHLSHLDLKPLERLDVTLEQEGISWLATHFARASFERLANDLQTVVTVAVYDMDRVRAYIHDVAPAYGRTLTSLKDVPPARLEHVDCAEIGPMVRPGMSDGVDVFYRPPRFGRGTDVASHSGWQCWEEKRP